jgi:formylglycine-generating enzyme required for sulfatase activity
MHGNIREWCLDWFAPVTASQSVDADAAGVFIDPRGAVQYHQSAESGRKLKTGYRALRGGSYLSTTNGCRSASRSGHAAVYNLDDGGVRLWLPAYAER